MPVLAYIIVAVAAYLLGSIPTGFLVAKAKGVDIRTAGSGNIGATNAMRVLGKPAGIFVLAMDLLKGFAAVYLCNLCLIPFNTPNFHHETHYILITAGFCAVL
ncbi:MAG TPA: glycerol-3-phosphate acyltransferase, partial [Candidatus Baltobacteraceae bacterium]|nr:glycerol-3-phosphate acyltransferase [Candidatus Baltobacteraceae bacterium]